MPTARRSVAPNTPQMDRRALPSGLTPKELKSSDHERKPSPKLATSTSRRCERSSNTSRNGVHAQGQAMTGLWEKTGRRLLATRRRTCTRDGVRVGGRAPPRRGGPPPRNRTHERRSHPPEDSARPQPAATAIGRTPCIGAATALLSPAAARRGHSPRTPSAGRPRPVKPTVTPTATNRPTQKLSVGRR